METLVSVRKVVKSGKSFLIALPPIIVRRMNLAKGSYVIVKVLEVNEKFARIEILKEI